MISVAPSKHALYRFFDAGGDLLYVGLTNNPGRRFGQHTADKPWWDEVDLIEIAHYPHSWREWVGRTAHIMNKRWFNWTDWTELLDRLAHS